jgi:hypothetical protein
MDENKNVLIVGLVVVALASAMFFVFRLAKKPSTKPQTPPQSSAFAPKNDKTPPKRTGKAYGSGPLPSANSQISAAVVQEMTKTRDMLLKSQDEMEKVGAEWLVKYLDDPNVATITREMYRARNNPNVQNGYAMLYKGDLANAKDEFLKAYNDPNSTPILKYTCLNFLMAIALQEKNPEEYFQFGIAKGEILAKEDLSCLDQEKSDYYLTVLKEKHTYFKARNSPAMQKAIADYLLSQLPGTPTKRDQEWAEKEVKSQIKSVEKEIYQ